jgi:AcrR family transcriptional regulator
VPKVSPEHSEARRQKILDSAMACFTENGVHPTSVNDIARAAGMSIGGLYRYFHSKHQIVEELFSRSDDQNRSGTAPDRLEEILDEGFARFGHPNAAATVKLSLAMHAEAARDPLIAELLAAQLEQVTDVFRARVVEGQSRGAIRADLDPTHLARVVLALFEGLKPQLVLDRDLDVDGYAATVLALLRGT